MASKPTNSLLLGDCKKVLTEFDDDYFSACITDPPYNYEFIGHQWDHEEINRRLARVKGSKTLVKNIPYGSGLAGGVRNERWYSKVRENIIEYENWCADWGAEVFRTLRPGAFALVFNSTRTVAHVQSGLERSGFYARDILVYRRHAGIPKGLNVSKKLDSLDIDDPSSWDGWHSCLRNEWEAICVVQKPLIGNYINTLAKYGVGLFKAEIQGNGFRSNIIEGVRRQKSDDVGAHCTVKPLELMEYLVGLVVPPSKNHVVLDPFAGTATTCLAAKHLGNSYVGIEINESYLEIGKARLASDLKSGLADFGLPDTDRQEKEANSLNPLLF